MTHGTGFIKYYWQHDETGRVCSTDFEYAPSFRWGRVTKEFYDLYVSTMEAAEGAEPADTDYSQSLDT